MLPLVLGNLGAEEVAIPSAATRAALAPLERLFRWEIERERPIFDWLPHGGETVAWLNTEAAERAAREAGRPLFGAAAQVVSRCHDKAFAQWVAAHEGLQPRALEGQIVAFDPADLAPGAPAERVLEEIRERLRECRSELGLTLKPRIGTSGRGRVPVRTEADLETVRACFARFRETGGCLVEPWLPRSCDLSTALYVSPSAEITIVGSAEQRVSPSGVYRGHRGQLDARGRMTSATPFDEPLREAAIVLARRAAEQGYTGPCGVDAFVFRCDGRLVLRSVVEFNARFTLGFVVAAALRERLREILSVTPLRPDRPVYFCFEPPGESAKTPSEGVFEVELIEGSASSGESSGRADGPTTQALRAPRLRIAQASESFDAEA